jgi:16S rRNA C967 or C1407 C5-methylase (RsmB/RsmF family)
MTLPDLFKVQMKNLLGPEYPDFEEALHISSTPSVRLNPFKSEHQLPLAEPVPWCSGGYYLKERPNFTIDPFFHAGHYYVQEASSMFIDYILRSINFKTNSKILDLCSAPGGKSTLLLSFLATDGFLHCHEYDSFRAGILKQNIERWGYPNTIVTSGAMTQLENLDVRYDLILIDAPCSGEGMFRKEPEALKQWNENKVHHCSHLQKNIMNVADTLCAEDG